LAPLWQLLQFKLHLGSPAVVDRQEETGTKSETPGVGVHRAFLGSGGVTTKQQGTVKPGNESSGGACHQLFEASDGARVELRDTGFGDAELGAQVLELHAAEVVRRDDVALAFGQELDGLGQRLLGELGGDGRLAAGGVGEAAV